MSWLQLLVLALVQGITEFLPISSSAHLILASQVSGWPDQGLVFDLAVHLGTLAAVVVYFRNDLRNMIVSAASGRGPERSMAAWLLLASIPLAVTGLLLHDWVESDLRSPRVIAYSTIGFGLLLAAAWLFRRGSDSESETGWRRALLIGVAQVLALIPGTSRAGITMTAGLFCGLNARASAKFSFLLAIPAIAMAGVYGVWRVSQQSAGIHWPEFFAAAAVAALAAFVCIHAFLGLIERIGMLPFVVYRLALGIALLFWLG